MPRKISGLEKDLRLFYETSLGYPITTSNWCNVKKKIKTSGQEITHASLLTYKFTCAASGKVVVTQIAAEEKVIGEIKKFCLENGSVNGKELHEFCIKMCLKYTTKTQFFYEQLSRLFNKAYTEHNRSLGKNQQARIWFSYKRKYTTKTLEPFFAFFCAWCKSYLNVTQHILATR